MSINRLLLRAFALNALSPQEGDAAPITMAGINAFDSRLDPTQFTEDVSELPVIIVYTDDDGATILSRADNSSPFKRIVELRVELAMGSFDTVVVDDKSHMEFGVPTTDAELEAKLDLFEQQVRWALLNFPNRAATAWFHNYVVRFESIESRVHRDEGGNNRLAMRVLNMRCVINDDCPPTWTTDASASNTGLSKDAFDNLPSWLRPMFYALQKSPGLKTVLDRVAGSSGGTKGQPVDAAVLVPLLKRFGIKVDYIWPAADPTLLAQQHKTRGPDGRIEYETTVELP